MNQSELLTYLNDADQDELKTLPGIGPALADRLMAARPFSSLETVQAVKGVSANFLERLMDAVPAPQVLPEIETQSVDEDPDKSLLTNIKETIQEKSQVVGDGMSKLGQSVNDQTRAAGQAVKAFPQKMEETARSRGPVWTTLVGGVITALVAILLTLAVLGGINGSLKYATGTQFKTMQREASQLTLQVNTLQQDLESLRSRVDTLEGLGERTVALEKAQQQLGADLQDTTRQVTALQTELNTLNEKVAQQEERTQRFETFLKDLQTLLGNLLTPEGETQ